MAADTIRLQLNMKDFNRAVRRLKGRAKPAIARALNRAALTTHTFMAREISKNLRMKVSDVKKEIRTKPADAGMNRLHAVVMAKGAPISLMKFGAKGPIPSRGRGRGVTARLPAPGKGKYPRAFIATVRSGQTNENMGVFERKGKARLPIKKLHGPSIAHVFAKYYEPGLKAGSEAIVKNLKHEFKYALSQQGG